MDFHYRAQLKQRVHDSPRFRARLRYVWNTLEPYTQCLATSNTEKDVIPCLKLSTKFFRTEPCFREQVNELLKIEDSMINEN